MSKSKTIPVLNQTDVHAARMYTREAAREIGLPLMEQARVSLATSSLAEVLKMGSHADANHGRQIIINFLGEKSQAGLRVDFYCTHCQQNKTGLQQNIGKIQSLVDEVVIETLADGGVLVSLFKWQPGARSEAGVKTINNQRVN